MIAVFRVFRPALRKPSRTALLVLALLAAGLVGLPQPMVLAQTAKPPAASASTTPPNRTDDGSEKRNELSQWVMTYYLHPDPDHFVERVKSMSAAGMLHDPTPNARPDASVMFLGKIMAAHPSQIREWLDALAALPAGDKLALKRAAWYSGTAEGNAWLEAHGEAALAKGPRPKLLATPPIMNLQPGDLDQLWEWFFATGDEQPIARIVSLFSLAHELPRKDSLDLLPPPVKPEAGSFVPPTAPRPKDGEVFKADDETLFQLRVSNYRILKPALWSCTSLAVQQDRVLELLRKLERTQAHAGIKAWLGQIIKIAETERAQQRENSTK